MRVENHTRRNFLQLSAATLLASQVGGQTPVEPNTGPSLLEHLIAERRIINVHEHIQDAENAAFLVEAMNQTGIGRTVLVGSSLFTLRLDERAGFTRYDENNEALLEIAKRWPGRFEAWPTLDPLDAEYMPKIRSLLARGASGVKLYLGHGYRTFYSRRYMFHVMALDDPRMLPLYVHCERHFVPICMHVNPDRPGFADEFIAVLRAFPNLKVLCPHWILSTIRHTRLREFLEVFPNLHVDISFGHDDYLRDGIFRISQDPERFRRIIADFPTRFFFGTDYVITHYRPRTLEWFKERTAIYYDLLSRTQYAAPLAAGATLRGLALPAALLENILYRNFERFMALRPKDTVIRREIDWSQMNTPRYPRKPGEALAPM
jgi:predicted TIM-barrel fold metal-dependent hydrolase